MNYKILHLSDLHISTKEDTNHQMVRNELINYIKEKISGLDAIVFTGDVIDRYDTDAFELAAKFFFDLFKAAKIDKEHAVFVPGNHDFERSSLIQQTLSSNLINSDNFDKADWKYIIPRIEAYAQFINKLTDNTQEEISYGYGVKVLEKDGYSVCFNLLNSAWNSCSNDDYDNLIIGRWQLEHNRKLISQCKEKREVITLMHHPLTWLREEDCNMVKDYMKNKNKFGSPILLHGHIHDVKIETEKDPSGGFVSLVSGIGYPKAEERESGQPKVSDCRFCVYDIDFTKKKVNIFCATTTKNGTFVPDTKLYNGSENGCYTISWETNMDITETNDSNEIYFELDPMPVTACWTGRKDELEIFEKPDTNVVAISGVGGQGKTALAAEFMKRNSEKSKFDKKIWVDCRELQDTMHVKLLKLLECITNGIETEVLYKDEQLKDTIDRFIKHIQNNNVLLVFDNVDAYVNLENTELTGELNTIVEMALTRKNNSLIVLTCRIAIFDSRANFRPIKLDGLKEPEAIDYFKCRGIKLKEDADIDACKNIIRITKGHPWWIGLICGQMLAEDSTPSNYLKMYQDGILARDSQLEQYFGTIWEKLGESNKGNLAHEVLRYLVEASKPLTVSDLCSLINNQYNQTNRVIKKLIKWSLLIEHDEKDETEKSFQVHPLVREFVHKKYTTDLQKPFVHKILQLFIGTRIYNIVFQEKSINQKIAMQCSTEDIIDSLETCLNSRNEAEALKLLVYSYGNLCDDGRHAAFLSLGGRILDAIDWKKEEIATVKDRAYFLEFYIDLLCMQEQSQNRALSYLNTYEQCCEKNTIPYSGYLITKATIMWRTGKYHEAYIAITEFQKMKEKHSDLWEFEDTVNMYGMILRDMGKIKNAIKVFENDSNSIVGKGNIARCYQKDKRYDEALEKLRECLAGLMKNTDLESNINKGYAFLWIAEIYYEMRNYKKANIFLVFCQDIWKEFAPGLLQKTQDLFNKITQLKLPFENTDYEKEIKNFLNKD